MSKTGFFSFFSNKWFEFMRNKYLRVDQINMILVYGMATWIFEWTYVLNSGIEYWSFSRVIFPFRSPFFLMLGFSYWIYIWGISVWRRTQYGKFTRGDRKLWAKGFAAFWMSEFFTIGGIFLAICWMSWGPSRLIPRIFLVPKKNFLIELTVFSYVVWIIYIMRLCLKWQLWRTQLLLTWTIVVVLSYLIWRDFILLYSREVVTINQGARWRQIKLGSTVYSLSSSLWLLHYYGSGRNVATPFMPLTTLLEHGATVNPFDELTVKIEYDRYTRMPYVTSSDWLYSALPWKSTTLKFFRTRLNYFYGHSFWQSFRPTDLSQAPEYIINKPISGLQMDSWIAHPRRYGFMPKKISMWYFLVYLKIWHHLMLFIWWFLLLIRIYGRRKTSYSFVSSCYFNVYCCFCIGLLVYLYQFLRYWELALKYKPIRAGFMFKSRVQSILGYYWDLIAHSEFLFKRVKTNLHHQYYEYSPHFFFKDANSEQMMAITNYKKDSATFDSVMKQYKKTQKKYTVSFWLRLYC